MPKVRRRNIPRAVLEHLVDRIRDREIAPAQLELLAQRLDREPEVPAGPWFKRFPGMFACGEGDLMKTFLRMGQIPTGQEID